MSATDGESLRPPRLSQIVLVDVARQYVEHPEARRHRWVWCVVTLASKPGEKCRLERAMGKFEIRNSKFEIRN